MWRKDIPTRCRHCSIAEQLRDRFRMLSILSNSGLENEIAGKWQDAEADYLTGAGHCRAHRAARAKRPSWPTTWACCTPTWAGWTKALTFVTRAQELAEDLELHDFLPFVLTSLGDLHIRREDWQAAEAALAEAEKVAQRPGTDYPLAEAYFLRSHVLRATGRKQEAIELAQRAVDLAHGLDLTQEEGKAWRALGQALLAEGPDQYCDHCLSAQPGSSGWPERLRGCPHQGAVGLGAAIRGQGRLCGVRRRERPGGRRPYPDTPADAGYANQSSVLFMEVDHGATT